MERGEVEETRALQSSVILTWSGMKYQLRRQQKLLLLRLLLLMCTQVHPQSVFVGGSIYLLGTSSAPVLTGCNYERPPSSQCRPAARLFFFKQNAAFFFLFFTLPPGWIPHAHTKEEKAEEGCCAGRLKQKQQQQQHQVKAKGQTRTSHFLFSLSKVKEAKWDFKNVVVAVRVRHT